MKRLTCELCGSNEFVKEDGLFVCQACGTKYSTEEAKKLMIECTVEITSKVQMDRSQELDNRIQNAINEYNAHHYERASGMFSEALNIQPDNAYAVIYKAASDCWSTTLDNNQMMNAVSEMLRALRSIPESRPEYYFECSICAMTEMNAIDNAVAGMIKKYVEKMSGQIKNLIALKQKEEKQLKQYKNFGPIAMVGPQSKVVRKYAEQAVQLNETMKSTYTKCDTIAITALINLVEGIILGMKHPEAIPDGLEDSYYGLLEKLSQKVERNSKPELSERGKLARTNAAKIKAFGQDAKKRLKAARYWADHAEEKQKLEQQSQELKDELAALEMELKTRKEKVDELKKQSDTSEVTAETLKKKLNGEISTLETQRAAIGLFKAKEKKEIDIRIAALRQDVLRNETEIQKQKQELFDRMAPEISAQEQALSEIEQKAAHCRKQLERVSLKLSQPWSNQDEK